MTAGFWRIGFVFIGSVSSVQLLKEKIWKYFMIAICWDDLQDHIALMEITASILHRENTNIYYNEQKFVTTFSDSRSHTFVVEVTLITPFQFPWCGLYFFSLEDTVIFSSFESPTDHSCLHVKIVLTNIERGNHDCKTFEQKIIEILIQ